MKILPDVLGVLTDPRTVIERDRIYIPFELDNRLYERVNRTLREAGGRWDGRRAVRAHVFPRDIESFMADAIAAGEFPSRYDTGWYPTPPAVVEQVLTLAGISEKYPGKTTLEPSAGIGSIAGPAVARGAVVDVVELDEHRASVLDGHGVYRRVVQGDFLSIAPLSYGEGFARVVMNPPFSDALSHVSHALAFLGDDGVLVSVLPEWVNWMSSRACVEFRALLKKHDGEIIPLPQSSFRDAGTNVNTVLAVVSTGPGHTIRNHSWHARQPKQLDLFGSAA
ncbi:hypothetical protein [Sphaerisporangium sp. NPDC051011]|uniref:hypothetical protein n=1 Tax=Sphaerisporangium sp. NPDC051011 TaxID=3155792 RepID=UPI003401F973